MNVLGKEQQKLYEKGISAKEYEMREKAFLELYYRYRKKEESSFFSKLSLRQRLLLHPIILAVYKIKNRLGGFTYRIVKDASSETNRPIIFAITHVGKFDIEVVSEAIKKHYYLLSGDYEHLQGTIDAPFLAANGVIYFNETVKTDRRQATERMVAHLKSGGNLMYFPEGTWNLSENLPVLPCYWGIVEIAQRGNAVVIPVAAEQYGKHFEICIGNNMELGVYGSSAQEKSRAIQNIRDSLATLKWEIWEARAICQRKTIRDSEWKDYLDARFKEWTYFDLSYVDELVYKPKGIASREKVFEHLHFMESNMRNAFLYDKRIANA